MSTLWTTVKERYDAQALAELTNLRDVTTGTIDDTVGERAVTAITRLFPTYVQEDFDESEGGHLEVGVEGVIALLFKWGGTTHRIATVKWDEWLELAQAYRNTHARARISPDTTVPTAKRPSTPPSTPYTPWSDNQRFSGLSPRRADPFDGDPDV